MDGRIWALAPLVDLAWRKLDDEWVVFDSGSGNTHQLPALPAGVLSCLEESAQGEAALLQTLDDVFASERPGELADVLGEVLTQLCELELIVADS